MRIFLLASALFVAACSNGADGSAVLRQAAIQYIEALRLNNVDIGTLNEGEKALLLANCSLASAVVTVYRPDVQTAPSEITQFCADVAAVFSEGK